MTYIFGSDGMHNMYVDECGEFAEKTRILEKRINGEIGRTRN